MFTSFLTLFSWSKGVLFKALKRFCRVFSLLPIACFSCIKSERVSDHHGTECFLGTFDDLGIDLLAAVITKFVKNVAMSSWSSNGERGGI